ncbi:conserved hypothetical protein [Leishmania mexicana MHOM/GT/2001/U1103]|uniref:Uncharacterized protein n=1 Tax=Leishmania mexicana (strain MHOM/GT/2001/U1103) TaxID=929439 RepID=E9B1K5_LEIMU|nr:conserved hypothetical protein [Leishmania mexicana MHOM/GT/2001/U1103]CBZ29111.1 conserved hypothetical protein [Leishmania mexicana MHOM/GT/2001/U1103]
MQTAPPTQQRRTFSRANGADGTAVPRLVAAEERHRKNLHQIQQLKQALCSTVSAAAAPCMSARSSRGWSLPSSTLSVPPPSNPSWMASSFESPSGVVPSPSQTSGATVPVSSRPTWTPASAAALRESHQEVERLVRERNKLQQQCVEWASLLGEGSPRAAESAGTSAPLVSHSGVEAGAWSPVHEAALAVVRQATHCYPSALREARIKSDLVATEDTSKPQCARSSPSFASHEGEVSEPLLHGNGCSPLTTEELADALHRLAEFLPRLASTATASELVASSGPDLLHRIHTLEEEKESDCLVVLSITDHLTEVATQLRREAAEKDEALHALQETVEVLMEEKSQWARRARESEEALAERYEQYSQREKAWEIEVTELLHSKHNAEASSGTATATEMGEGHIAQLQQELEAKGATLSILEEEHRALQATYAALQTHSQQAEAAHQKRIAELESQLNPLEEELQTQACIIGSTLREVEDLSVVHQTETVALVESHNAFLAGKEVALLSVQEAKERIEVELAERTADAAQMRAELETALGKLAAAQRALDRPGSPSLVHNDVSVENSSVVESTGLLRPTGPSEGDGDGTDASLQMDGASSPGKGERAKNDDAEDAAESPTELVNVRKLQQSLSRMSRERTALKRKLEHRADALSEMESELEAALRLAAQRGAQVEALTAELERAKATDTSAPADAKTAGEDNSGEEEADAGSSLQLMDFSELERYEDEGTLYPDPVDLSEWLLGHAEGSSVRFSTYVQHHLSENEQLRIAAVGPLYHIGFTLLKMEGLVKQEDDPLCLPMLWRRFLLQLQQVLDVQLQATVLSPADSAKCFYALASSVGFFGNLASPPRDPLTGYSLIIAALCVCLRSPSASTSTDSSCKWQCCQAILRHVSHYGDGKAASQTGRSIADADSQALDSLFLALCAEFPAATALHEEDAGDEGATASAGTAPVPPPCPIRLAELLASDLLSDHLPISHLALCAAALADIVTSNVVAIEGQLPESSQMETAKIVSAARPRVSFAQERGVAPLLLYVARYEYLLFGWAQEIGDAAGEADGGSPSGDGNSTDTASLTLSSLGVSATWLASATVQKAPSRSAAVSARATLLTEVESITQLLIFLCAGLLPALVLAVHCCPSLERESPLIDAFFRTRRLLMAKRTALLAKNSTEVSAASGVIPGVSLLLPEAQLRNLVNAALAPIKHTAPFPERAVQVPVAEYKRLHHELLSLYETNDTYHRYIQELLSAAEAA